MTTPPASRAISSSRTRARSSCPGVARTFEALARQAREAHWPYEDYLHEVLSAEHASRHESVIRQRLREARFPEVKTLDTFDFAAAEGVQRAADPHARARRVGDAAGESDPRGADRHRQDASGDRARRRGHEAEAPRALYARGRSRPAAARSPRCARARPPAAAAPHASTS